MRLDTREFGRVSGFYFIFVRSWNSNPVPTFFSIFLYYLLRICAIFPRVCVRRYTLARISIPLSFPVELTPRREVSSIVLSISFDVAAHGIPLPLGAVSLSESLRIAAFVIHDESLISFGRCLEFEQFLSIGIGDRGPAWLGLTRKRATSQLSSATSAFIPVFTAIPRKIWHTRTIIGVLIRDWNKNGKEKDTDTNVVVNIILFIANLF